jgi:hypothetical protein
LDRLFIDFEAWLADLAKGAADARASLETELSAKLDSLAKSHQLEAKLRTRYLEAVETRDPNQRTVESSLNHVLDEKARHQERIRALQAAREEPGIDDLKPQSSHSLVSAPRLSLGVEQHVGDPPLTGVDDERLRSTTEEPVVEPVG